MKTDTEKLEAAIFYLDRPYKCPLDAVIYKDRLLHHELGCPGVSEIDAEACTCGYAQQLEEVPVCNSDVTVTWEAEYGDFGCVLSQWPEFTCMHPELGEDHTEYLNSDERWELEDIHTRMQERSAIGRILRGLEPIERG